MVLEPAIPVESNAGAYDDMPYPGAAYPVTHPNRLAALARLLGVPAADPSTARVLELGGSDGGNIIAMAEMAPRATFLCLDHSPVQIAAGRRAAAVLGVPNLELRQQDLLAFGPGEGTFDYIIAHGLYSWVPEPVREKLLALIAAHLRPHGVAFVSYNALPGSHTRVALRQLLQHHTRHCPDRGSRLREGRALVRQLGAAIADSNLGHNLLLKQELRIIEDTPDFYFWHEHFCGESNAFSFEDFDARVRAHGLQYLAEAKLASMLSRDLPPAGRQVIAAIPDQIGREPYLDFFRHRAFRETLLCRADVPVDRRLTADAMGRFAFRARFVSPASPVDLADGVSVRFRRSEHEGFDATQPFAKAACQVLGEAPVRALGFEDLIARAYERARPHLEGGAEEQAARVAMLRHDLLNLLATDFVEIFAEAVASADVVPERPRALAVTRHEAMHATFVTNRLHEPLVKDLFARHVLALCDGTRTAAEIVAALVPKFTAGTLGLAENGQPITGEERIAATLRPQLTRLLAELCRQGMFA
jgi:methyltransferase-like protein/SAM-dependent methyltransferase